MHHEPKQKSFRQPAELRLEPELATFKAETYRLEPTMTVRELLQLLASGKEAQFPLRFVEGQRLTEWPSELRKAPYIRHTLKDDQFSTLASELKFEPQQLEGNFFPDT